MKLKCENVKSGTRFTEVILSLSNNTSPSQQCPTTPVRYTYCWHSFPRSYILMNFHLKLHSFPYTLVWLSFMHVCVAWSSVGIRHQAGGFQINLVEFLFQRKCNLPNKAFLRSSFDSRTKNKRNGWSLIFLKLDPCLDLQKIGLKYWFVNAMRIAKQCVRLYNFFFYY